MHVVPAHVEKSRLAMPIGTFTPFDDADLSPRYFARPIAFDCECPRCGRLILVGKQRRDNAAYDRVTGILRCVGCQQQFLIGLVAWNIRAGRPIRRRPHDQKPNERQLAELRQAGRGVWPKASKPYGSPLNSIQEIDDDEP